MRRPRSVLVIEDDATTACDGREGLERAVADRPDLVLLDLMLPSLDGVELCRRLRSQSEAPVIMLTARSTEDDKVEGLGAGADDYVAKPFSPRELVARIEAVLRRGPSFRIERRRRYEFEGLSLNLDSRTVVVDGKPVALTPTEFDLLAALCRSYGTVLTRSQLVESAIGYDYEGTDRSVDAHIAKLRKKLRRRRGRPEFVATVFGVGYRFVGQPVRA
jgi:DNA-binding response OmpR family regulator